VHVARTVAVSVGLLSLAALAAGADGSWTQCAAPARLSPDPGGRTFYVSTTGNDGSPCTAGSTFRTIPAAVKCALGKDTILVHGGTYAPFEIDEFYPSDWVLITNAPGENPIIDGQGAIADWSAIVRLYDVSKLAFQGLEIRNTGVPAATLHDKGGLGFKADKVSYLRLYFNTIHDTARHGVVFDGSQVELVGNEIYNTVMRNQNEQMSNVCPAGKDRCAWEGAVSSSSSRNYWGQTFRGNSIHDSWGECLVVGPVDGATVEGNKIFHCLSSNLDVANSQNVTVNRNWIYANTDAYNRLDQNGDRAEGIFLNNEGGSFGWSLNNIRITNNIVEWLSNAIRYWADNGHTGPDQDTYNNVYIGFNDMNRNQHSPMRFDSPPVKPTAMNNKLGANLVLNTTSGGAPWVYMVVNSDWNYWVASGNYVYSSVTTTTPGIVDPYGTYIPAYAWRSDATIRWAITPNSQPEMPSSDYHCAARSQGNANSPGAVN
jgi:hypothetical protein